MPKAWHAGILGRASSHPRSRRLPGFKIFRPWKSHTFFLNVLFSNGFLNAILSVFLVDFCMFRYFQIGNQRTWWIFPCCGYLTARAPKAFKVTDLQALKSVWFEDCLIGLSEIWKKQHQRLVALECNFSHENSNSGGIFRHPIRSV